MVGRTRYTVPLPDWLARKFDALERQLDYRVIASVDERAPGSTTHERFRLLEPSRIKLFDGVLFYLRLPFHVRRQIIDFRPDAIMAESPYSAAASLVGRAWTRGQRPQVIVEIHGDWRTATRLYGSPSRRVLSPLADAVGRIALRRGDAVRGLSSFTEGLVEEVRGIPVTASFVAYVDLSAFTANPVVPLPEQPTALFVGMLEAYKNIDGLVGGVASRHAGASRRASRDRRQGRAQRPGRRARRRASRQRRAHRASAARAGRREDGCCDVPAAAVSLRRARHAS